MMGTRRRHPVRNIVIVAGAVALFILYRLSFLVPGLVENVYSRGFFAFVNQLLSSVTGILPFSLAEFVFYAFLLFVAAYLAYAVIAAVFVPGRRLYGFLCRLLVLAAVAANVFASFVILWGFNYARQPISRTLDLSVAPVEKEALFELCAHLAHEANSLRAGLPEDEDGVYVSGYKKEDLLAKVPDVFNKVSEKDGMDFLGGSFGPAKPILNSRGMSYAGLAGVYFPFTGEANVNTDLPGVIFAAAACHEAAHQRGIAREDEANFIAYFVCRESGDDHFVYPGVMLALIHATKALRREDPKLYQAVVSRLSGAVQRDLDDYYAFWKRYEGPAEEAVEAMNNTYLKANMQKDGVKSYGRMVDLLIAQYFKETGLIPCAAA